MRQPNEYWLKYMILSGFTPGQIVTSAKLYGMVPPKPGYIIELTEQLARTKPDPYDVDDGATKAWLRRQRVYSMIRSSKEAEEARNILGDNRVQEIVILLLTSRCEIEEIIRYTRELTGKTISKKGLDLFRHYFWNVDLLPLRDLTEYLKAHPDADRLEGAWNTGEEYALWKLGYRIEMPKEELLRGMIHEASMRFFETTKDKNHQGTAMKAKMWSEVVFKAMEEQARGGEELRAVIEQLKGISIKLEKKDIQTIEDLTGGNYSTGSSAPTAPEDE